MLECFPKQTFPGFLQQGFYSLGTLPDANQRVKGHGYNKV